MIAEVLINTILFILGLSVAIFVLCGAVGLVLVVFEEVEDRIDWHRYKKYNRENSEKEGKEQRAQRIARIERELGINTRHKQPP